MSLLDYDTWMRHGGLKRKMFGVSGGGHEELFPYILLFDEGTLTIGQFSNLQSLIA